MKISALAAARIAWVLCLAGGVICGLWDMAAEGEALSPARRVCSSPEYVHVKGRFVEVCPSLAAQLRWSFAGFVLFFLLTAISVCAARSFKEGGGNRD
ncbi:MAG: hypothetical protein QOK17_1608 [Sphingomonadales bacterium]|jgi:hypothetical protein|nr:hypothetical protein [Sphingomonadales bacterium]